MDFIRITPENLAKEHICCAISNNGDCQVASKKAWLAERLKEGLVFCSGERTAVSKRSFGQPGKSADSLRSLYCLFPFL